MTFILDAGVVAKTAQDVERVTAACARAAGKQPETVGYGCSLRDMQFSFDSRDEADAAELRIRVLDLTINYTEVYEEA